MVKSELYYIGDTHGVNHAIRRWNKATTNSVAIHVGDLSLTKESCKFLGEGIALSGNGNILYVVRGNHDIKDIFDNTLYSHKTAPDSGLVLLKDYSTLDIEVKSGKYKILTIGGGISLNRVDLIQSNLLRPGEYFYRENEPVTFDEKSLDSLEKVDIVVSHSNHRNRVAGVLNPSCVKHFFEADPQLYSDIEEEDRVWDKIWEKIKGKGPKLWINGHYHRSASRVNEGIQFTTIDINEIKAHYHGLYC